jgi:hypothetical protein
MLTNAVSQVSWKYCSAGAVLGAGLRCCRDYEDITLPAIVRFNWEEMDRREKEIGQSGNKLLRAYA